MEYKLPNKEEVVQAAQDLINGVKTPSEVARWAERINYPENSHLEEKLAKENPALAQLLSDLGMADLPGDSLDERLYIRKDYENWLQEFLDSD